MIFPRVWGNRWPYWCIKYAQTYFFSPINACIWKFFRTNWWIFDTQIKVEEKGLPHASMKNISGEVSIFCLWNNWIHLVTCSKIEFREPYYYSRYALDKICEIYTFVRCPNGWSSRKISFGLGRREEQLNNFLNMCPNPFSWAKNKRKLFFRR